MRGQPSSIFVSDAILVLYGVAHSVNDPQNEIPLFLVDKFRQTVVCVDAVNYDVGGGVSFQYGMLQS